MRGTKFVTHAALVAALYVVLTYASWMMGLSSGAIQLRLSEALTILPCFMPAAVPGLFVGCLLSNLLTGCAFWDVVFGSVATLLGALGTYLLRRRPYLSPAAPILANTLIVPFVLQYVYGVPESLPYLMLTVGLGELISCGGAGVALYAALRKRIPKIVK